MLAESRNEPPASMYWSSSAYEVRASSRDPKFNTPRHKALTSSPVLPSGKVRIATPLGCSPVPQMQTPGGIAPPWRCTVSRLACPCLTQALAQRRQVSADAAIHDLVARAQDQPAEDFGVHMIRYVFGA